MTGPQNERRAEMIRTLIVLAIISAVYLVIINQGAITALWREFVRAL